MTVDNVAPSITTDNATVVVSESATASNSGTVSDPGDDELTIAASLGTVTLDPAGTWQWQFTTVDGPDQQTVTVTITDSDGDSSQATFDLTVDNVDPVISVDNATVTIGEGGVASNSGTFLDVGLSDVITLSTSHGTIVDNGNGTWNWTYSPADGPDETGAVTVTATDSDGGQNSQQFNLVVENVAPQLDAAQLIVTGLEGTTATNTGTYADVAADTVTLTVNLGQITDNGDGTWLWSHAIGDGPGESQTILITATDSDGDQSTVEFEMTVENVPPFIAVDNSEVTTAEASTVTNSGTYGDFGADTVTLTASIGTLTDNGDGTWAWTHTPADGPADSATVTITATDSDGDASTVDFTMEVTNEAPTVGVDTPAIEGDEGVTVTNSGTVNDVGNDAFQLSASIGSVVDNGDGTWSWTYTLENGPASIEVSITATDEDGDSQAATFDLTVNNVPPSVTVNNSSVATTQGAVVANSGSYVDVPADVVTLTASIGQVVDNADGTWSWNLDASDILAGAHVVDIVATDPDGATATVSFDLTVENAPPVVTINQQFIAAPEGATVHNQGTLFDAGNDPLTIEASVGTIQDNGDGTWSWSVATTDGPDDSANVDITVTDPSGASVTESFQLVVDNIAPSVTLDVPEISAFEGDTVTNSGTFADQGDDEVTLTASTGIVTDNGDGTWSWSLETANGPAETQTVIITATDSDQGATSVEFELNVFNVAPTISVDIENATVDEGAVATNGGTFFDPGTDTILLTASDGEVTDLGNGQWGWTYTAGDGPADSRIVTITINDGDGGINATTFLLSVTNLPPTLAVDEATVNIPEGQTGTTTGTFADPGSDPITIVASVGEVTVQQEAGTWTWSHLFGAEVVPPTVTLTATDSSGEEVTATFDLAVTNAPPLVDAASLEVTVPEGQTATNTGTYSDVGGDAVAVTASIGLLVDNGDGTWTWSASTNDGPVETQPVTVTATDSEGATSSVQFELIVENLAPNVSVLSGGMTVIEGLTATNTGTYSDVAADTVTLEASIGQVVDNGDGTFDWSFVSTDGPAETQTVTITATDDDGGDSSSSTFALTVTNQDPLIDADEDLVIVVAGTTATNSGTWSDFGDVVELSATNGTVTQNPDGTWDWQLEDVQVTQDVRITATDDDGGLRRLTFEVRAQTPSLSVNGSVAVLVGTDLADDITVTPGTTTHNVTMSGFSFELAASVTALHVGAGFGEDTIQIFGTTGTDTVDAGNGRVTVNTPGLSVDTYSIEHVTFDGLGGDDVAELLGTTGTDRLEGALSDITLITPDFTYRMINVDRVNALGNLGADVADVQGSSGSEFFASLPDFSYIENPGTGVKNYFKGFEEIIVDGLGSTDYTKIVDSTGDDQFTYFDTHIEIVTAERTITLNSFEVSTLESINGGTDTVTFVIDSSENHLVTSLPTELKLTKSGISSRAIGFDTMVAQATGSGTHTARIEQVSATEALFASGSQATMTSRGLTLDGFDSVVAEALTGESPTLNDDQPFDFLLDVIGDWL